MISEARVAAVRADVDRYRSCYPSVTFEDGIRALEWVHERRADGSCKCGHYAARK